MSLNPEHVALVVPTLNAGSQWNEWLAAVRRQTFTPGRLLVIDSSSDDETTALAASAGFDVQTISRSNFDHGGTRQLGVEMTPPAEVVVLLTQDAFLQGPDSIENLLKAFDDASVGAAYGRQLARTDAAPFERHARLFNYPEISVVKSTENASKLGIKAVFISNSFAAYRRSGLAEVGGFPSNIVFGEDTYTAAKMILAGWKVAYCADACVVHSHNGSAGEELRRYFDIGVLHSREPWIRGSFGQAEGEGLKYVRSTLSYLLKESPLHIPSAVLRIACRLVGYKLGHSERRLPIFLKRHLSMNKRFWDS